MARLGQGDSLSKGNAKERGRAHVCCEAVRIRIFSRGAAIPLAVFGVLVGVGAVWAWWTMIRMPGRSYAGSLEPLDARGSSVRDRLRADVEALAGSIGERSVRSPRGLSKAADHIAAELTAAGLTPARQTFVVEGVPCDNVEAEVRGRDQSDDIVIVGAHYDSVAFTRGANDNGSGVAALLALARTFATQHPRTTLRFVAFANEEPPYFQTPNMGSLVYALRSRQRRERIVAMLSLETIGYYSDEPGTQRYPLPLSLVYPDRGNFIGFVGDRASVGLVRRIVGTFRAAARFPSEGAALVASLPGVGWSDQWSFWQVGYPGVMVTDTAPFRYPRYHTGNDTPDQLDYARMTRVVIGLEQVVGDLSGA